MDEQDAHAADNQRSTELPIEIRDPALTDWLKGSRIAAAQWSSEHGCLYIITRNPDNQTASLLRAFRIAGKVNVSVDLNELAPAHFIARLLEQVVK